MKVLEYFVNADFHLYFPLEEVAQGPPGPQGKSPTPCYIIHECSNFI